MFLIVTEILRNGDRQVAVPIGPHEVMQNLYVDGQQPMPRGSVANGLLNECPQSFEQERSLAHD